MAARASEKILSGPVLRLQPDRRLVALTGEGSEAAIEEIVRRYRPALVRYARSIVGADRAEDVVQDSLAKAVPAIGAGVEELHLRPWLYTIVRNTGLNALRDAGPTHQQLDENHDGVEQPPQALERSEQMRSLVRELKGLPETQREALVKREMEGRSHDEIAADLGVSSGAARQLIFRARDALRAGLGSLVPMPLLRYLVEGGGDGGAVAVTTATGGGALAAKAAVAIVATGAVIGGGLAVRHAERHSHGSSPPPVSREAALPIAPAGSAGAAAGTGVAREVADQRREHGSHGSGEHEGDQGGEHRHRRDNGGDDNPGSSGTGNGGSSGSPGSDGRGDGDSSGEGSNLSGNDGGSHHGGDGDESHGGGGGGGGGGSGHDGSGGEAHSGGDPQAAETIDSDSNSGSGGGSSPGGPETSSESGSGSDGSGSGSSGADGGGDDSTSEASRDSGGGDGLSGVTDQQLKEER
jgi:RNA polymerase sigma factor (sigma-70 family)